MRQHATPQGQVTDVFVPSMKVKYLGTLALGVTPNKKALASAVLIRSYNSSLYFYLGSVILGAVFNALTITRPVRESLR